MLVVCFLTHFAFYNRVLQPALDSPDHPRRQVAMRRWVTFAIVWQLLVLVGVAAYVFPLAHSHPPGGLWIAPVLAAVVGTAVPLQLVLFRLLRSLRRL